MAIVSSIEWGIDVPVVPSPDILDENISCGLEGLQPWPGYAPSSQADGCVDVQACFIDKTNHAPDVLRSYSETYSQAFTGPSYEDGNHNMQGTGAPLSDQTLGVNRIGYRGMADEPLPVRPPMVDDDADYDQPAK